VFRDIDFTLGQGEVLGIAGLAGSGRSELARAIFGADPVDHGQVLIDGSPVCLRSIRDARTLGIALVPEDRRGYGLVLDQSLQDNIILPSLDAWIPWHIVTQGAVRRMVEPTARKVRLGVDFLSMKAEVLSGGNQQKAVIGKWILNPPRVLIADEPTAGIDVFSKAEIYRIFGELTSAGVSILLIASDLSELLAFSDRVMVMNAGRVLGTFASTTPQDIMSLIMKDVARGNHDTIQ